MISEIQSVVARRATEDRTDDRSEPLSSAADYLEPVLIQPAAEFLRRPGKRIRQNMVEIGYRCLLQSDIAPRSIRTDAALERAHLNTLALEQDNSAAFLLPLGEFIERLHAGSLIVDDIQDHAQMRRGRTALHRQVGVSAAINVGNWLYFSALEQLGLCPVPPPQRALMFQQSIRVIRQCHEGQALDLALRIDQLPPAEVPDLVAKITAWKTGGLIELATWLGAVAAGGAADCCDRLAVFGRQVGIALQMQNDRRELLAAATGQSPSDDLSHRRVTWPWAWLAQSVPATIYQRLLEMPTHTPAGTYDLARELHAFTDAPATKAVRNCLTTAAAALDGHVKDTKVQQQIAELLDTLESYHA